MNTESGATELLIVYQMPIYNRACAVLRMAYYASWRNAATIINWELRAYDIGIFSPFRTVVGEVSSGSHRDLNIRNGFSARPAPQAQRNQEGKFFLDIMLFFANEFAVDWPYHTEYLGGDGMGIINFRSVAEEASSSARKFCVAGTPLFPEYSFFFEIRIRLWQGYRRTRYPMGPARLVLRIQLLSLTTQIRS